MRTTCIYSRLRPIRVEDSSWMGKSSEERPTTDQPQYDRINSLRL